MTCRCSPNQNCPIRCLHVAFVSVHECLSLHMWHRIRRGFWATSTENDWFFWMIHWFFCRSLRSKATSLWTTRRKYIRQGKNYESYYELETCYTREHAKIPNILSMYRQQAPRSGFRKLQRAFGGYFCGYNYAADGNGGHPFNSVTLSSALLSNKEKKYS